MENQLQNLILQANKILITSHISPDPDAVSSLLLLGRTIKENYPDKEIVMALEEEPLGDLRFLSSYDQIRFAPLSRLIVDSSPDLFIVVDANNYDRVSRVGGNDIRSYITSQKDRLKTAIIDHHEPDGIDKADVLINNKRPATAEEIYSLCFDQLTLKQPEDYAETALLGIISDTQRHRFDHPGYRETYRIVSDLLDAGASIEKLEAKLEHYNKNELEVISHLAANIVGDDGYTYSFISDEFLSNWLTRERSTVDLKNASELFVNKFIRSYEGNTWGFIIYPDPVAGPGCWGVSFRALSGTKDVSAIARILGGGGHKPAAGAKLQASSVADAINRVREAIKQYPD